MVTQTQPQKSFFSINIFHVYCAGFHFVGPVPHSTLSVLAGGSGQVIICIININCNVKVALWYYELMMYSVRDEFNITFIYYDHIYRKVQGEAEDYVWHNTLTWCFL